MGRCRWRGGGGRVDFRGGEDVGFYLPLRIEKLEDERVSLAGRDIMILPLLHCSSCSTALCMVTRLATALWTHRWSDIATEAEKELWL